MTTLAWIGLILLVAYVLAMLVRAFANDYQDRHPPPT